MADHLGLLRPVESLNGRHDQLVDLLGHGLGVEVLARVGGVVERLDERRDLVQRRDRLIEELADERRFGVVAVHSEDVVQPSGNLAVARMFDRVLPNLMFERLDVVVDRVGRKLLHELGEEGDRFRVEIDLLEVGIQEAVERHDLAVGRLPGGVEDVARVCQLASRRVRDDPVELAPAGLSSRVGPGVDGLRAVGQLDLHLTAADFVDRPRHRRLHADRLAALGALRRMLAELDLPQPVTGPARSRQGLLPNHVGQDRAGLLARVGLDVDPLEEVAIGGE